MNNLNFMIMTIIFGIILIIIGIGFYSFAGKGYKTNDWMCMIGFMLMMTGALFIGMTLDGKL